MDPQLHEIGYFLEFDQAEGIVEFKRREDFYIDNDLTEGGRIQVLSESVSDFQVEFLFREIEQAAGGSKKSGPPSSTLKRENVSKPENLHAFPGPSNSACLSRERPGK